MELLPLVCLCLLTCSGTTFADEPLIIKVTEGSDVTLPCSFSTTDDIRAERFEWKKDGEDDVFQYEDSPLTRQEKQFKGRVSHFDEELKNGDASITIKNTKVADTGDYTCYFPSIQLTRHMKLRVGAISKPHVRTLGETKDGVQLQCEVHAATFKPHVQWQDTAGNILPAEEPQVPERGGSYIIILNTTVTKNKHYRCVATQEEISHQVYDETYVPGSATGRIVGPVLSAVLAAVVLFVL